MLEAYGITEEEYYDYAGHYLNVLEEIRADEKTEEDVDSASEVDSDYELMAYSNTKLIMNILSISFRTL